MKRILKHFSSIGRFLFVWLVLISAFVFAMFQGGQVSWTIFYSILPFILYAILLFIYPLKDIEVSRVIKVPVIENGGRLVIRLNFKRKWYFPLLYTVVSEKWRDEDQPFLAKEKRNKLFLIGFRREITWDYEINKVPRGEHVIEGVSIEVSDLFGWIRKTRFVQMSSTILVYPRTTKIHYTEIGTQYEEGSMTSTFNLIKDTNLATGVRDYQTGDRVAWIHWKSFARTQTLMTKEFEDKRSRELTIILDGRPSNSFEEQVTLTASILKDVSKQQITTGFLSIGDGYTVFPSLQIEEDFRQAQIHLAKIKPSEKALTTKTGNYGSVFQTGRSIIIVTGSPDWGFMESIARNVKNISSIICFAVIKKEDSHQGYFLRQVEFAKTKGIVVHILTQERFSEAFKEVTSL